MDKRSRPKPKEAASEAGSEIVVRPEDLVIEPPPVKRSGNGRGRMLYMHRVLDELGKHATGTRRLVR